LLDDLPRSEVAKLDGPAILDGDSLQVTLHNGTSWQLREVVIGLTILRRSDASAHAAVESSQKRPDSTVLLRAKGSAAPSSTALFRTPLNFALFPDQEWRWAILKARGVAPQAAITQTDSGSPQAAPVAETRGSTSKPSPRPRDATAN
jgi:hypothetical protein